VGASVLLTALTGDWAQWAAFGIGVYALITWGQVQACRDKPLYRLTFGDPTYLLSVSATAVIACIGGTIAIWSAPYAMRTFAMPATEVGALLGGLSIAGSLIGVIVGGWLTDAWRARDLRAPMGVAAIAVVGIVPSVVVMLSAEDPAFFFGGVFVVGFFSALWSGSSAALVQDLVLPRMRGSSAAGNSLIAIVISSGIGPYWAGKVSAVTGSLTAGLLSMLALAPVALLVIWLAARRLPRETPEARLALAIGAGEPV
jgi:MFS family permease